MDRGLLRVSTAGSVDDGKSTLFGRLLFDAKSIFEDQLVTLAAASTRRARLHGVDDADTPLDLSLVTDGLIAEREQGITIDVAYRYFSTPTRKYILADTPGHEQYTRNMVTGASTADLAIILLDATKGVLPQSKRHAAIASLLGIRHVVVAVNKMDLVDFSGERFEALRAEFGALVDRLGLASVSYVPLSALHGDMVVERGARMPWYAGPTLMDVLENASVQPVEATALRLPIQLVRSPGVEAGYVRGYMGRIESGRLALGDRIVIEPSGHKTTVEAIYRGPDLVREAFAPHAVTVVLADEFDVSRGNLITHEANRTQAAKQFSALLCWMDQEPLDPQRRYLIKHTTRTTAATFPTIDYRLDIESLAPVSANGSLGMNDIGRVSLRTRDVLSADNFLENRATGAFIVIDEVTNHTVAAGMIGPSAMDRVHG
jgi:sulfate adenylyltransferase subunit 1